MLLSILDFGSVDSSLALAPLAEDLGYHRYWLGEHHSHQQCSNPLLLGSLLAAGCTRLRLGSGGICLGHRNVLRVAEDARLIEYLLPDRFDFGVTQGLPLSPALQSALLEDRSAPDAEEFGRRVEELHSFLTGRVPADHPLAQEAAPGLPLANGARLWVLDNRPALADLAARLGVGLAISLYHDYRGRLTADLVRRYRDAFRPGPGSGPPEVVLVVGGLCGATEAETERLYQGYLERLGDPSTAKNQMLLQRRIFRGAPATAAEQIADLAAEFEVDEIMVCDLLTHDHPSRVTQYQRLAGAWGLEPPAA